MSFHHKVQHNYTCRLTTSTANSYFFVLFLFKCLFSCLPWSVFLRIIPTGTRLGGGGRGKKGMGRMRERKGKRGEGGEERGGGGEARGLWAAFLALNLHRTKYSLSKSLHYVYTFVTHTQKIFKKKKSGSYTISFSFSLSLFLSSSFFFHISKCLNSNRVINQIDIFTFREFFFSSPQRLKNYTHTQHSGLITSVSRFPYAYNSNNNYYN